MVQENIKVMARIRPFSENSDGNAQSCLDVDLKNSSINVKGKTLQQFHLNKVFNENDTQQTVFNNVAVPIIDKFIDGMNGNIFAYGQTGSGKTFSMIGPDSEKLGSESLGIIPRAIERIFDILNDEKKEKPNSFEFTLKCSFLQIYNEKLYDLLQKNGSEIQIFLSTETVTLTNVTETEIKCYKEFVEHFQKGLYHRKTAKTLMNQQSSRSHAIFKISLETTKSENVITRKHTSYLNLIDLAGSENQKQTGNIGIRLQEAGNINKSLTTLALVIRQIIKKEKHVSYRDTLLTSLLRDSLGGNSKTTVLVNIHSDSENAKETTSTLKFAKNVKLVKNTAKINETFSCEELESCKLENSRLQQENDDLKSQVSNLCKAISKNEKKIKNLEAQLVETKDLKNTVVKELESKNNEIEKLWKEKDQLKINTAAKIQKLQDKIAELEDENIRFKDTVSYSIKNSDESGIIDLKTRDGHPCEILSNDIGQKMLFIFVSNERKNYYAYKWSKKQYCCVTCKKISVKISDDGYVEGNWSHGCSEDSVIDFEIIPILPNNNDRKYPLLVTYIETKNYQLKSYVLSLMTDENIYRCQRCSRHESGQKNEVYTRIWKNRNGKEYVRLTGSHICRPVEVKKNQNGEIYIKCRKNNIPLS